AEHGAQCGDELIGGRLLHDVAGCAFGQQPLGVDGLVVHGQHQYADLRKMRVHVAHHVEAIALGQRQVDQQSIGFELTHHLARLLFGLRLAADGEIGFGLDHQPDALTHHGMIVNDQHPAGFDGRGTHYAASWLMFTGQRQRSVVPAPGRDSTERYPPISCARYRMIRSPMPPRACCSGSKPLPSSMTSSSTSAPATRSRRWICVASAWRAAFSTPSCAMRYRLVAVFSSSVALGGRLSSMRTRMP